MQYRLVNRTVTLQELLDIIFEWTHEGADLFQTTQDNDGNLTGAVLIDHGQRIHATYTVGLVSDPLEPYISKEEQEYHATIAAALALVSHIQEIEIQTIHDSKGRVSCWHISIPSLGWQPALPYGYCYTPYQLFHAAEAACVAYQHKHFGNAH
jgi:hypothetical protein